MSNKDPKYRIMAMKGGRPMPVEQDFCDTMDDVVIKCKAIQARNKGMEVHVKLLSGFKENRPLRWEWDDYRHELNETSVYNQIAIGKKSPKNQGGIRV